MANTVMLPTDDNHPLYSPLDPDRREIRLLQIACARSSDLVEVTLHTVALEESPDFSLVSNVWDPAVSTEAIRCDGHHVQVYSKLVRILRDLRDRRNLYVKSFWTDALCVDKNNLREKSYQATLMAGITLRAQVTIGWPDVEISQSTATFLGHLSSCAQGFWPLQPDAEIVGLVQNSSVITSDSLDRYEAAYQIALARTSVATTTKLKRYCWTPFKWFRRISSSATHLTRQIDEQESLTELSQLVESHYFERMWVLPDIVLSSRLLLRCGSVELDWDVLSNALGAMIMYGTREKFRAFRAENLMLADLLRIRYRRNQLSYPETLLAARYYAATSPQDSVKALLPLHNLGLDGVRAPQVDYSDDAQHLFRRLSGILGDAFNSPIFLSLSFFLASGPRPQAQSWLPQFDCESFPMVLAHPNCHFSASSAIHDIIPNSSRQLTCRGSIVDKVLDTCYYLPPRRICDQLTEDGANYVFWQWYQFASGSHDTPDETVPDELLVPFAETIQARGCNHVWEGAATIDSTEMARRVRTLLRYMFDLEMTINNDIRLFIAACLPSYGRRLGRTTKGRLCLLPQGAQYGDLVCLINGSKVPILLRKLGIDYVNVGECYVHGIMHGELGEMDEEDIVLE
ncbi:hypothetical protein LTR27_004845 [Elasticomyces elasticus]|nr:hypothetical protein LTR27_004845 [Elasticomyces elasticus]